MLITFSGTESATWFAVLKWLQRVPKMQKSRSATHISITKYHLGKMTSSPLCTNVPVVLYIGIIQLRLYDNLFFSSRKESKELMLKETAAPLNGFFYFDFLG